MTSGSEAREGRARAHFLLRHRKGILFAALGLCAAGAYAAFDMPAAVFPQTDFPRVVILIDHGVMPADEMMATITRPIEEAMKDIPGSTSIRSATGRGSAEVNVFFDWSADMVETELYVLGRVAQVRSSLPAGVEIAVHRLTFSAFPIVGVSLVSPTRSITDLWETARYDLKPQILRIEGVARVKLVGGAVPEYHVVADPEALEAHHLTINDVDRALSETNLLIPAGMQEENRQLYLRITDNRIRDPREIEEVVVAWVDGTPILVRDVAAVRRGASPRYNIVSADGARAVLLNVYGQPDSNTVGIADALGSQLREIRRQLPPDMRLALFYDQSEFVREGIHSVWESIFVGLLLSALVLLCFLRSLRATILAAIVVPMSVLFSLLGLWVCGMSFNLMTLGGVAAAIGLIIDDAIVMVEAIHSKLHDGHTPAEAVRLAVREVGPPLIGSTLTPTVVFIPLAFLDGVPGVFFRALALTMVFALLSSLLLAVTWTPAVGTFLLRRIEHATPEQPHGGRWLTRVIGAYEWLVKRALARPWLAAALLVGLACAGGLTYLQMESDFLPEQDEGAFVLDYFSRPGTSLSETDRMLRHVESILASVPEVESFSRRTGARLALAIAEPNTGDFLVKLAADRGRSTAEVIDELRERIEAAEPALHTEFPGVLGDLIGDLTWSPDPVEIKLFSTDTDLLKRKAQEIAASIEVLPGVVDVNDGLVVAGPSLSFRVRGVDAARAGLQPAAVGATLRTALLGDVRTHVLNGDRTYGVRVLEAPRLGRSAVDTEGMLVRSAGGSAPRVDEIASVRYESGILEMHREDLRQLVSVSARFSGMDLGHGIQAIQERLDSTLELPPGVSLEYGGLYEQQQESFRNLTFVLLMAVFLVFGVLIAEFQTLLAPLAIILGAVLALMGTVLALYLTGISFNIVSFLGAIIGVGIVAKNGILMLDHVEVLRRQGYAVGEALVFSGRRRLRPVLMTSFATMLGLMPLAVGAGAGADMLRPLAVAILGALFMALALSLIATPVFYDLLLRLFRVQQADEAPPGSLAR